MVYAEVPPRVEYSITEKGCEQLETYRREWTEYKAKIDNVLFGGISNE